MYKPLYFAALLLGGLVGCKKEPTELERLPAPSQDGRATAGWLLDGKAQVPARSSISTGPPVNGFWRKTKGGRSLGLSFRQFSMDADWGASFFLPNIQQTGTFALNRVPAITSGLNNAAYGEYSHSRPDPRLNCYTGPNALGQLVITRFDTVQNVVSGTFEMTPREDGGGTTVTITHGRFDMHFDR